MNRNFRQQKAVGTTDRQEERRRGGYGRSSTAFHFVFACRTGCPAERAQVPGFDDRGNIFRFGRPLLLRMLRGPRRRFDNGLRTFIVKALAAQDPQKTRRKGTERPPRSHAGTDARSGGRAHFVRTRVQERSSASFPAPASLEPRTFVHTERIVRRSQEPTPRERSASS
jgi:hypothetical protein